MEISAKVIADSISEHGDRLVTLQLCYPRFVHAEFMTHRVFSRNAMSSRAIPVAKMIEQVVSDPAMPVHWGKNQPGMQARAELTGTDLEGAQKAWRAAAGNAAFVAKQMSDLGAHKQVVNRILEPFQWMHTIVTATDWFNFFDLRCHPDAEPNMQALANAMRDAINGSTPYLLQPGQWHLPYVSESFVADLGIDWAIRASVARCARVSYLTHDGYTPDPHKDRELHDKLVGSKPMHASPAEHQATPDRFGVGRMGIWQTPQYHGNFKGWRQYRKILEHAQLQEQA